MKTLFAAESISKGGRSGTIESPSGLLNTTLGNPLAKGEEKLGPNPELLFASAYAACYHGALKNAAKALGHQIKDSKVRSIVKLLEDDKEGFHLSVDLYAQIPDLKTEDVRKTMEQAHKTCPYSKALRGDAAVTLHPE